MSEKKGGLNVRELIEQYPDTFFLGDRPLLGKHHQKPLAACKQFGPCLLILQSLRNVFGIASDRIPMFIYPRAFGLFQLTHLLAMFSLALASSIICHDGVPYVLPARPPDRTADDGICQVCHSLKETSLDNILHALVEIQGYLFDAHSPILTSFSSNQSNIPSGSRHSAKSIYCSICYFTDTNLEGTKIQN